MNNFIELSNLTKTFVAKKNVKVLKQINFKLTNPIWLCNRVYTRLFLKCDFEKNKHFKSHRRSRRKLTLKSRFKLRLKWCFKSRLSSYLRIRCNAFENSLIASRSRNTYVPLVMVCTVCVNRNHSHLKIA